MGINTKANGLMIWDQAKVGKFTIHYNKLMKETLLMIKEKVKENIILIQEIFSKVNGKMIKRMEKEWYITLMETFFVDIGLKI